MLIPYPPELPKPMEEAFDNPASPFIDVEAVTDEEEEEEDEMKTEASKTGAGGEQAKEEQKMLSLAEQFLAAMPDRIKFESGGAGEEEGSSAGSLSVTIGVRHLAGARKSGITQETEIVAQQLHRPGATFGGPALNLVHKPNFWCNIPADCNAINFILAPMTSFCASHLPLEGFVRNPGAGVFCSK